MPKPLSSVLTILSPIPCLDAGEHPFAAQAVAFSSSEQPKYDYINERKPASDIDGVDIGALPVKIDPIERDSPSFKSSSLSSDDIMKFNLAEKVELQMKTGIFRRIKEEANFVDQSYELDIGVDQEAEKAKKSGKANLKAQKHLLFLEMLEDNIEMTEESKAKM